MLKIYSPIFDLDKPKWKFDIGDGRIVSVDISETSIAQDALERGMVSTGDVYKVTLEMKQVVTPGNQIRTYFKVKEVKELRKAKTPTQTEFYKDES